ncbi:hypothetical protein BD410DRAFT_810534, partial [Rickenella mellea]
MAPQRWATDEELKWLLEKLPVFLSSNQETARRTFMARCFEEWWIKFPVSEGTYKYIILAKRVEEMEDKNLTAEELAVKIAAWTRGQKIKIRRGALNLPQQIENWFKNNSRTVRYKAQQAAAPKPKSVPVKRRRLKQDVELFQELYGTTLVKPTVDLKMENQLLLPESQRRLRITVLKEVAKEVWAVASDDIRREVAQLKEERQKEKAQKSSTPEETVPERSVQEIQISIDGIHHMQETLDKLAAETGWEFLLIGAGRDPRVNYKCAAKSLHTGQNELGNNFAHAYPNFDRDIAKPFVRFAKSLH